MLVDRVEEIIEELERVYNAIKNRGFAHDAEIAYGLGLVITIASAVELGKDVSEDAADKALYIASLAIERAPPRNIPIILHLLRPLRDKAPARYIQLWAQAIKVLPGQNKGLS